ncbi:MAG: biofilm synthesis protein PgaB [Verrucomicrobiales bacterium]|nr:biofilm synthesis protein PgaB [Verrucomicrobiales bacterium]
MNARIFAALLFSALTTLAADTRHIHVALYDDQGSAGKGVPCVCTELGKCDGMEVTKVSAEQIRNGVLDKFDIVAFTGGSASLQAKTLGEQGRANVKKFIEKGGGYMGICAGAYLACNGFDWAVGVLDAKTVSPKWQRGMGMVQIELTGEGQKLLSQTGKHFEVKYENGPIITHNNGVLPPFKTLAVFRTEKAEHGSPVGVMVNSPAIVTSTCGKGRVVVISPHPEQSQGAESMIPAAIKLLVNKEQRLVTPRNS